MSAEHDRLEQAREQQQPWKKWGPYLSERQWGTVREDYSESGDAWNYFSHDEARSRAYRWGEDGLAGISDDRQLLCFALALWNGEDPILKERLFGLTNSEGNHGEDVKEYYFYLDSTPTHSYMKYLYKYPQQAYPYDDLVQTNRSRRRHEMEYELLDTGVFDRNRYFDVVVEYAKAAPEDILVRITVHNRGPEAATLHLLPTLWFRNTWSWGPSAAERPPASAASSGPGRGVPPRARPAVPALPRTGRSCSSPRTRPTSPGWSRFPTAPSTSRTRSTLPRPRPGAGGESGADRHQGRGALPGRGQGRRSGHGAAPLTDTERPDPALGGAFGEDLRRDPRRPAEGGRRVLRRGHSRRR